MKGEEWSREFLPQPKIYRLKIYITSADFYTIPFSLTNFTYQMSFDCVNEEFSTNLSKIPNLHGEKHLTHKICRRKFGRVKGA